MPPVVSLAIVFLIAWQLARIAWMLVPAPAAGDPVATPAAAMTSSVGADVTRIAAAHLFGVADAEDAVAEPVVLPEDDLADTRLANLVLKGTIASRNADYSVAVISNGGTEDTVYSIGKTVTNNTTLHAIYADRVVLNENGQLTNLRLPREFKAAAPAPVSRRETALTREVDPGESIQAVVSSNLTRLTDVIRPTPYIQDGKPVGYRVYPGRDREQFAALGLRPGDIIMDIDGQSLTDPTQAMQIFQSLGDAQQVTVTVERQGQAETLVLSTDQLELAGEATQ